MWDHILKRLLISSVSTCYLWTMKQVHANTESYHFPSELLTSLNMSFVYQTEQSSFLVAHEISTNLHSKYHLISTKVAYRFNFKTHIDHMLLKSHSVKILVSKWMLHQFTTYNAITNQTIWNKYHNLGNKSCCTDWNKQRRNEVSTW